jgi:hypothetical protein
MREPGHVVALLPSAAALGPVHDALACCGVHGDVRAPTPGRYLLEDETLHEELGAGRRGLVVGFAVAAIVGIVVVTAVPTVRDLSPLVRLVLVLGIALQGTLPAILWRMGRVTRLDDDPVAFRDLDADDRLVIVEALHEEPRVRHALERHGAVFLAADEPLARVA